MDWKEARTFNNAFVLHIHIGQFNVGRCESLHLRKDFPTSHVRAADLGEELTCQGYPSATLISLYHKKRYEIWYH